MNDGPAAAPPPKRGMPTWMVVAVVVGALFAFVVPVMSLLAVYGVRKYLVNAKTAEARNAVRQIAMDAATAYDRDHALCPSASRPVPASMSMLKGTKHQSVLEDWQADHGRSAGFACLGFAMDQPQYFQYSYVVTHHGAEGFAVTARGDLNGDGKTSTFVARGKVEGGHVVIAPDLEETDPEE